VTRRIPLTAFLALAIAVGLTAAVQAVYFQRGIVPGDATVYLAAGERLNAGHALYALSPGDRPVDINPPYWTVPLVSPPPIAVLFRPFALLPGLSGAYVWWALQLAALGASLVLLARRKPYHLAVAMLVLLFPTVYEIGVGNVNSFLLLGLILTWRWVATGREEPAGAVSAVLAAIKLTPAAMIWWLLMTGHRRAVLVAIVTGIAVLAVSILGAGLGTHLEYLRLLGDRGAIGISPLSLGGMAVYVGVPDAVARLLPALAVVLGLLGIVLLRSRPAAAFAIVVLTMLFGSPAVSINWYTLLYALLAPLAWPLAAARTTPVTTNVLAPA
jgi:alpha-1,2-mannosyltransferase